MIMNQQNIEHKYLKNKKKRKKIMDKLSEWAIVVEHQVSNFSDISWQEQVYINEMMMVSALY